MSKKTPAQDPDESIEFDPLTNPLPPPMDPKEAKRLRRQAYMKNYAKNYKRKREADKKAGTGRPVGRPPKSAEPSSKSYKPVWAPLYKEDGTPGPQFALLSCPFPEIFFGGARGGGKGGALDSVIMTPFGYRYMQEMRLGQAVCNPDGSVCHIIGVYPLGERQLYRVTFHDGTSAEVTDDHIWLTWKSNKAQKSNGVRQFGQDSARLWATKAMMEDMKTERNVKQNFLIPITHPVPVNDVSRYPRRPVPPYLLGVLLGDGYLSDHMIRYAKPDREIADVINRALEKYGFVQRLTGPYEGKGKCPSWGLSVSADSELVHHLRKLELIGMRSLTKFIPEPYLLGTVEERWELLRGLMDTDGWAEEDGDIYFGTSSSYLRDDTAHLARSLGAVVTIREKEPTYTYKGETLSGQTAWTLRIKLREPSMAFHLERKKARCQRSPQSMFRMVVSIEPSRIAESQCIRVSHPNGLYLTNDFIVTHNTDGAIGKWLQHASRYGENAKGVFFRRRFKQLEDVQARCTQIFSRINATYNKGDATWVFPNGAVLKLRHLWDIAATEEYHGHSYCVAEGTPILMADGSYRPIETIQVDDLVMTLEGPKPVTATMAPGLKPCVRVEVFDSSGEKLGEQIHPEDHPVLTRASSVLENSISPDPAWWSYEMLLDAYLESSSDDGYEDEIPPLSCPVVLHVHDRFDGKSYGSYVHGYTGQHREIDRPYEFGYAVLQPCEPHVVFDLTVKEANHYITENRMISLNSFLCFEEVTNWSTPDAINRLRGTLRSSAGVMPELIMTGNPGGSGHCVPFGDVLTPSGWVDIEDMQVGDPVITVTPQGEMVETVVGQIHRSHYTGPMVFLSQDGVSITCTPNHGIGIVGSDEAGEIVLRPLLDLSDGFFIPRAVSYQGAVFKLDQHARSELDMSDCCCEMEDYDGEVYCIGVPDTHSFIIQQNGSIWISGNSWVKARYISPAPQGWTPIKDEETGELRIYIPSRLTDNSAMMKNDPTYANRLRGTGSASLVNAWLNGDWDIVAGGFFDDLIVPSRHFLQPFSIPPGWSWRRSFDWGSAAPAYLAIWAVSDGNPVPELDGFVFPRGSLILVKEWYTCAKTKSGDIIPNDGLRLTNLALGQGIAERSLGRRFSGCVADPSIYSKLGRESIYDEMRKGAKEVGHNLIMAPADNNRVGGWQKMRDMLESAGQERPERPGLWVFETCAHWLRTVPVMQRSDTDFDDVDTTQEDHCLHGDTLVETRDGHIPIRKLVGKVGEARQANGSYMCFFGCRLTRKDADTITLTTKDGRSLICTPDHFILTLNGWMHAIYTLGETIVCVRSSTSASPDKGAKVTSIVHGGIDDVFNLEVEHTHAFAVNGGLIVHNCADSTRYACMTGSRTLKVGDLIGR